MYTARKFSVWQSLLWSKHAIFALVIFACIPTLLFQLLHWEWMRIPWLPISVIAIAAAFYLGFKNNASYDRTWEARKIWGAIVNSSRAFTLQIKDFITLEHASISISESELSAIHLEMVNRHVAWMIALRHQLRQPKPWEHNLRRDRLHREKYNIREHSISLEDALRPYIPADELAIYLRKTNVATQILGVQSKRLKEFRKQGLLDDFRHVEMQAMLTDLFTQQGKCERIKNFPFPRQYASLNIYFVKLFVLLLPFGLMHELNAIGNAYVWLTIPLTVIIGWIFYMMEAVGDYSENPFEGLVGDVPITSMSRGIEIDLLELIDADEVPAPFPPAKEGVQL